MIGEKFTVIDFSRKTGDYGSLSATDLKVLALTYMLEVEHVGAAHLPTQPTIKPTVEICKPQKLPTQGDANAVESKRDIPASQRLVGFVHPKHDDGDGDDASEGDEKTAGKVSVTSGSGSPSLNRP